MTWSLEDALLTAESMRGRGYGLYPRTSFHTYRMDSRDQVLLFAELVLGLSLMIGWYKGYCTLPIYSGLQPLTMDVATIVLLALFALMTLLPVLVDGKAALRWHYIKLKI